MSEHHPSPAEQLRSVLPSLPAKDLDFARSLLAAADRGRASPKQAYWIGELAKRAAPAPSVRQVAADLSPVVALFDKARRHLKHPAVLVPCEAGTLRLRIAGENSRYTGQLQVMSAGRFDERDYYGRVDRSGAYYPSRDAGEAVTAIGRALAAFSQDPAGVARDYARLTGNCCFCNRALTDRISTAMGYGETCAANYGQPWGRAAAEAVDGEHTLLGRMVAA